MKTQRYFYNDEDEEMIVLTQSGDENAVLVLPELFSFEIEDEESEKPADRIEYRASPKKKERLLEMIGQGMSNEDIAKGLGWEKEKAEAIIDGLRKENLLNENV